MERREFLGTTIAAALAAATAPRELLWSAGEHLIEKIGMQLYTVRGEMKRDFDGTLAKVAQIGYKEVEFAGYFDRSPKDVRAALDRSGLIAPSTHVDYQSLGEKWPQVIEASQEIGHEYIVNPWIDDDVRKTLDGWKQAADRFNHAGEASKKAGIQFAYHNHHFEFFPVEGKVPYDLLLEQCDPNLVKMEMDLCWITVGGADPIAYFNHWPGRFPMVHVKDVKKVPKRTAADKSWVPFERIFPDMTEVGSGAIDWKRIFAQSDKAGIRHYFVEHDEPKAPFDSLRASYEYLRKLRF